MDDGDLLVGDWELVPVDSVGDEVVVLYPVVQLAASVVHPHQALLDTPLVLGRLQSPELPGENIGEFLPHPAALGVGGEGEVVGSDPPESALEVGLSLLKLCLGVLGQDRNVPSYFVLFGSLPLGRLGRLLEWPLDRSSFLPPFTIDYLVLRVVWGSRHTLEVFGATQVTSQRCHSFYNDPGNIYFN